jgi:hypothetical protein
MVIVDNIINVRVMVANIINVRVMVANIIRVTVDNIMKSLLLLFR